MWRDRQTPRHGHPIACQQPGCNKYQKGSMLIMIAIIKNLKKKKHFFNRCKLNMAHHYKVRVDGKTEFQYITPCRAAAPKSKIALTQGQSLLNSRRLFGYKITRSSGRPYGKN